MNFMKLLIEIVPCNGQKYKYGKSLKVGCVLLPIKTLIPYSTLNP